MKILHITFVFCSFLSCNAQFSLEKNYKFAQKNNINKEISSDYVVGALVVEAGWSIFCKLPCNKKLFKGAVIPEGHNIFRRCREVGDTLEEPYQKKFINQKIKIDNKNDTAASIAVKGLLKARDECLFLSGKYFSTNPIKSGLLFTAGILTETEILRTKLVHRLFSNPSHDNTNTIKNL